MKTFFDLNLIKILMQLSYFVNLSYLNFNRKLFLKKSSKQGIQQTAKF